MNFSGYPQTWSPAYNPIYFYVDSTHSNYEGFKYLIDVFSASTSTSATTSTKICRYKLFPRPIDGIGVADLNQILSTQLSFSFNPTINNWRTCPESWVRYDVYAGEEYVSAWTFYDNFYGGPYVGFTGTTAHNYAVGDQINIIQVTGATNTQYNGVHNIISATTYSIQIDVEFGASTPPETGTTGFADHRKSQFSGLTSATGYTAFNGSIPHEDFMSFSTDDYNSDASNSRWVTSMPNNYKVKIDSDAWVNYVRKNSVYNDVRYLVITTDDGGQFRYTNPSASTSTTEMMMQIALGPNNLNSFTVTPSIVSGSLPPIKATTTRYTAHTETTNSGQTLANLIFDIDTECTGKYTNVKLIFLDRMGSFMPANFELRSMYKINITKEEYQQTLGNLNKSQSRWTYDAKDRGRTNLNTVIKKEAELTSNWMTETNATFLEEFFTSPEVYIYENGSYWPVIVTNSDYSFKTKLNEKLINYTCTIAYANNNRVQNF